MPLEALTPHIRYYPDFESREAAFGHRVADLIPCRYGGPKRFWRDFRHILERIEAPRGGMAATPEVASITSNPIDCLAFGTPFQVLAAARLTAARRARTALPEPVRMAAAYDLSTHLDQPIRSLSGGETVKLALAKAAFASHAGLDLVVASPFCWLAEENLPLLVQLVEQYRSCGRTVSILALAGENDTQPACSRSDLTDWASPPPVVIQTRGAVVRLGAETPGFGRPPATAQIEDTDLRLTSPVLLVGDNGQGKSVVAKAAAGALPAEGLIRIGRCGVQRRARLLFQDVITQTFLRRPAALMDHLDSRGRQEVVTIAQKIRVAFDHHRSTTSPAAVPKDMAVQDSGPPALIDIKMTLVAVRLASAPGALILDEPDWGLSRTDAMAFVGAVIRVAHDLGLPVVLISHKAWWRNLAGSRVMVRKTQPGLQGDQGLRIRIRLVPVP